MVDAFVQLGPERQFGVEAGGKNRLTDTGPSPETVDELQVCFTLVVEQAVEEVAGLIVQ